MTPTSSHQLLFVADMQHLRVINYSISFDITSPTITEVTADKFFGCRIYMRHGLIDTNC